MALSSPLCPLNSDVDEMDLAGSHEQETCAFPSIPASWYASLGEVVSFLCKILFFFPESLSWKGELEKSPKGGTFQALSKARLAGILGKDGFGRQEMGQHAPVP